MSQENLRVGHAILEAVEHRDLARLVSLTHPQVEWRSAFAVTDGGLYRGHAGMERYVADMNDAWGVVRLEVEQEMAVGDVVIFVGRIEVRGKGSGVETGSRAGYVLRFRDGLVVLFRPFRDPEQALGALGQADQPAR